MYKLPKLLRLTAQDAEKLLFDAGFVMLRSKGSHRIYLKENSNSTAKWVSVEPPRIHRANDY